MSPKTTHKHAGMHMHALMQASTVLNAIWMALVMCSSASASWSVEDVYVLYSWSDGLRIAWSNLKKKKAIYSRKEDGHVSNIFFYSRKLIETQKNLLRKRRRKEEKQKRGEQRKRSV